MKKYYGPIVLGLAAMTVAAPIANATTVLADQATPGESVPSAEDPAKTTDTTKVDVQKPAETKDANLTQSFTLKGEDVYTGEPVNIPVTFTFKNYDDDEDITLNLDKNYRIGVKHSGDPDWGYFDDTSVPVMLTHEGNIIINDAFKNANGRIPLLDITGNTNPALVNNEIGNYEISLNDFKNDLTSLNGSTKTLKADKEMVTSELDKIKEKTTELKTIDDVKKAEAELADTVSVFNNSVTSNDVTVSIKNGDDTKDITIKNVPMETGEATDSIDVNKDNTSLKGTISIDKDGKTTVTSTDANFTIPDETLAKSSASAKEINKLKRTIMGYLNNPIQTSNSNKAAMDEFLKPLQEQLDKIKDGISANDLSSIDNTVNKYLAENTTGINIANPGEVANYREPTVPILKNSTVYIQSGYTDELIEISFDKDGNISSSTITDKNHNKIKTNHVVEIWKSKGTSDGQKPQNTVISKNSKPVNNNSNSSNTKKPETKPAHIKTINDNHMVFYAFPNQNLSLYTEDGNIITNRALGGNTSWLADKLMDLDGSNYVRVATNEWARLADGLEINNQSGVITTKNDSALFTAAGNRITNRGLAKNTSWRTDMSATINGHKMYRVATNEWISATDLK